MNLSSLLLPLIIVVFAIPLFLGSRKQRRTQQAQQALQNSLSYGDRVMTTSGLYGTVVSVTEESIDLEIAPGVVTSWLRAAVREKVADSTVEAPDGESPDESEHLALSDSTNDTATDDGTVVDAVSTESDAQLAAPLENSSKQSR